MEYLIYYLLAFIIIYLFYLFTVILQTKRYEKFKKSNQVMYFVNRYHINPDKLNMKRFTNLIGLVNAFIIATGFMATFITDSILLMIGIGIIVIVPLMLLCYHIIGKYYQKKEGKKHV